MAVSAFTSRAGQQGQSGFSGYSGSGTSGYSGYSGTGISGYSGYSGTSGSGGSNGTSGFSGYSGTSGSGATPAGTVVSVSASYQTLTSVATAVLRSIKLPANTYSFVRARATGYMMTAPNARSIATFTISGIGTSLSPSVRTRNDATGTGDLVNIPWAIEYQDVQTASRSVVVNWNELVGSSTAVLTSFVVEGIL